ncbi:U3 small nucleolar RNA-associated protein 13 [Malassezia yamatoensis]|uniref:U3 small nucleolar RNA-associated protein 13 n=1 Tax=Malassezia yamatoensis TaxID=253288 RepID=A0AAJ5YUI1_9BASI|nr:U3 small nucleolar RNA-associated protein 13 [Malassezia yamatoensis]
MASGSGLKPKLCTSFEKADTFQPFYTGGAVAITQDGAWCVATFGTEVMIVETTTSKILHRLQGDGSEISSLTLTMNDAYLITVARSLAVQIYSLPDFKLVRTIPKAQDAPVALMSTDPTSALLALGSTDGSVKVYDIARGYTTHVFAGHGGVISALAWQVQKQNKTRSVHLYTGCIDGKVRMWDLNGSSKSASKPTAVLSGHAGVVRAVSISPDGRTLISGARDQTVAIYSQNDFRWERREIRVIGERIEAARFLTSNLFYTAGSSGMLRVWSTESDAPIASQTAALDQQAEEDDELSGLVDACYAQAVNTIVGITASQEFAFIHVDYDPLRLELIRQMVGYNDEIVDLAVLQRDDKPLLAVASNNSLIRIYCMDADNHDVMLLPGHHDMVLSLDTCNNHQLLASASKDRTVRIWAPTGTRDWRTIAVCEGHAESIGCVKFPHKHEAASFLVTASQDRTVKIWDLSQLNRNAPEPLHPSSLLTLRIHDKDINAVDLAPNDALLLSASQDRTAKVFRLEYTAASKSNQFRASASLRPLATCRGHKRGVWSCEFSPAEQAFATGSGDQTVRLWSLKDYSCVRVFEGHTGSVLRVSFLPLGMQLASSASDGLVKIWNVKDEECATTIDAAEDKIWTLAMHATDTKPLQVITGAADSTITTWTDTTEQVQQQRAAAAQDTVEREQEFANLLVLKDYRNAIALALQLNQPRRLLTLFTQIATSRPDGEAIASIDQLFAQALGKPRPEASITGLAAVDEIIAKLPQPQIVQLLEYIRDWNTSARTAPTAQLLLHAIVRLHSADFLINAFAKHQSSGSHSLASLLDALLPYTERHYARADRMLIESAMLQYTLQAMDSIVGTDDVFIDDVLMDDQTNAVSTENATYADRSHDSDSEHDVDDVSSDEE